MDPKQRQSLLGCRITQCREDIFSFHLNQFSVSTINNRHMTSLLYFSPEIFKISMIDLKKSHSNCRLFNTGISIEGYVILNTVFLTNLFVPYFIRDQKIKFFKWYMEICKSKLEILHPSPLIPLNCSDVTESLAL